MSVKISNLTFKQAEKVFNKFADMLHIDLNDIQNKALLAANGGTFERMVLFCGIDKCAEDHVNYFTKANGTVYVSTDLIVNICHDFFGRPVYENTKYSIYRIVNKIGE